MLAKILGASTCFWFDNQTQKPISGLKKQSPGGGAWGAPKMSRNKPLFSNFLSIFPFFSAYFPPPTHRKKIIFIFLFSNCFRKNSFDRLGGEQQPLYSPWMEIKDIVFLMKKTKINYFRRLLEISPNCYNSKIYLYFTHRKHFV